jgi:histidine triad (HIT) family protein
MSNDCLFCKIVSGEIPSTKVYEDKEVVAFLDIFPFTKGHTVVVPVEHHETFFDFPDDKVKNYFCTLRNLADRIRINLKADGLNIVQNNFRAAGQIIFHMHYHIIPRWVDDNRPFLKQPKDQATPEYLAEMLKLIKG